MGVRPDQPALGILRLGLFSDFHFSNAFIVPSNPGLDVMSSSLGLTYHLKPRPPVTSAPLSRSRMVIGLSFKDRSAYFR